MSKQIVAITLKTEVERGINEALDLLDDISKFVNTQGQEAKFSQFFNEVDFSNCSCSPAMETRIRREKMLKLYSGSGSQECKILSLFMPTAKWNELKKAVIECLRESKHLLAAQLLESCQFEIHRGTNSFDDDFLVLFSKVSSFEYLKMKPVENNPEYKKAFKIIADMLTELELEEDNYIRFIVVSLKEKDEPFLNVPNPKAKFSVLQTLREAQTLIDTTGPASAVDRVHTALHRYLIDICVNEGLAYKPDDGITSLYKTIRNNHSVLTTKVGGEEIKRIMQALSSTVDSLNTLRNNYSNAHPNPLLGEAEATLAINSARTILHYLDAKLS